MSNLEFSTSPVAARPFCPPSRKNPMDPAGPNPKHKPSTNPNIIRWRKGELIGAGAFGRVYMGMNLDSGELLAVKQVLIAANSVAKEKAQKAHLRELEEEVKLLQNLSHPNIVRYLGTARENGALNIFLEFVPGGSIASLLGKFGSFPEPVVRMYSRQLLQGLEYLHKNGIMHRDIKGANILVDNKGCIKLADFGASKQVVELVTITGAKSMKGTPYWMAPEVIRQTGHSLPADIWSVGCTVIEMATGKAPWSQQFQEVAALFHIGTTKSHPPIPEHLSHEAQDFLLKCLKQEPNLRPTATQLLQHPFIRTEGVSTASGPPQVFTLVSHGTKASQVLDSCKRKHLSPNPLEESSVKRSMAFCQNSFMGDHDSLRFSVVDRDRIRGSFETDLNCSVRFDCDSFMLKSFKSACDDPLGFDNHLWGRQSSFNPIMDPSSFNPIHEPPDVDDGWCNLASPGIEEYKDAYNSPMASAYQHCYKEDGDFSFQCTPADDDDDDEVTESKIKAFLDEKALELKRLQTPLYMEFHEAQQTGETNSIRSYGQPKEGTDSIIAPLSYAAGRQLMAPNSSQSPSKGSSHSGHSKQQSFSIACSCDSDATVSSDSHGSGGNQSVNFDPHVESPRLHEWKGLLLETQQPLPSPSTLNSSERLRLWKEELQQELEMRREEKRMLSRLASSTKSSPASKFSSPKEKTAQRHSARKLATGVLPMS